MTQVTNLLQRVYDATNSGLDIIIGVCPEAADAISNKKNFRLRSEERTPSAHLYPPKDGDDCWHVKDFGMGEGGSFFSPIDLWMQQRGYTQSQFAMAVHELAEMYGVREELSQSVNKPLIEQRSALPDEVGQPPRIEFREGFTDEELRAWGPCVKSEHLTELGWKAVVSTTTVKDGKATVKKSTPTYPIFAQACEYTDQNGNVQQFMKLYEPMSFNKAFRFSIIGKKPQHYIFGLSALRRRFEERSEEKLDEVVLVSGGSDAVNCLSMGYQPVWLGSETEELREDDMRLLQKYAKRIVNIPDTDSTGIKAGRRLALRYPQIYTVWMTGKDMGGLHDNRGRLCKDLKNYIQLHPRHDDMQRLMARAKCALYWSKTEDKDGNTLYSVSPARLNYYLMLNGYYTLSDNTRKEPLYIHVDGARVSRIVAKTVVNFILEQAAREGLDEALLNKLMRCRDMPTDHVSHLEERSDLDFTRSTATSQRMFFRNGWVEVTAEGIRLNRYSDLNGGYVWEDAIIPHDYRAMKPMFSVEKTEMGYRVDIAEEQPSKFFQFVINSSRLHWRKEDEFGMELSDEERAEEHQCLASKLACIGYMLFGYKSESEAWAPFCQDSKVAESEDECNGGSGKSLFLQSIGKLLSIFCIDAHTPSVTENRFLFDGVTADTDLIIVDECDRRLNYDFFFGRITGDLKGEEKGHHPFLIPFAQSPKFAFATNYVLKKHDASTERRIWPQVFADYYHEATRHNDYRETRTIRDDIGCNLMGTEYSEQDWQADIAFMLQCLVYYLSQPKGERRIMPPMNRIEHREQMAAVGKDFKQWADDYFCEGSGNLDCKLKAEKVLYDFNQETGWNWPQRKMTQHIQDYCQLAMHIHCYNPISITKKKNDGDRWVDRDENNKQKLYYYIMSAKTAAEAEKTEPLEQTLQFGNDTTEDSSEENPL